MNDGNKPRSITEDSLAEYLAVEISEDLCLAEQIIWDIRQYDRISLAHFTNEVQRAITMLHIAVGKRLLQETK